jgi:small subunit ribosomal protein S16
MRIANMVKIRLTRVGSKKRPFYRVTAIDERKQRDGRPLEFLGTYDPRPDQEELKLDIDGIQAWVAKGAQMSDTVRTLVKRVQRRAAAGASS